MSQVCTVCTSPERAAIDRQLVIGSPMRAIACQSSVGRMALQRHRAEHLPALLAKAYAAEESARADDLLKEVGALRSKAYSLLLAAERSGDLRTALLGVREARACLELLAELQGELSRQPVVNVVISAEWQQLVQALRKILAPHPAILADVSAHLVALEGGRGRTA